MLDAQTKLEIVQEAINRTSETTKKLGFDIGEVTIKAIAQMSALHSVTLYSDKLEEAK